MNEPQEAVWGWPERKDRRRDFLKLSCKGPTTAKRQYGLTPDGSRRHEEKSSDFEYI